MFSADDSLTLILPIYMSTLYYFFYKGLRQLSNVLSTRHTMLNELMSEQGFKALMSKQTGKAHLLDLQ